MMYLSGIHYDEGGGGEEGGRKGRKREIGKEDKLESHQCTCHTYRQWKAGGWVCYCQAIGDRDIVEGLPAGFLSLSLCFL
jgi:hypothetical protein